MQQYEIYMKKCFELALLAEGNTSPNPMVGCVVLNKSGEIIAEGYHKKCGEKHAERDALDKISDEAACGSTLVVNLEPCSHYGKTPPCVDLIISKKVARVVIAMRDVNPIVAGNGVEKLKNAGIEVIEGVLENEAKKLNEVFIKNMCEKKAFIALKTATTLDGKTATRNGSSKWITSEAARTEVKRIRNRYDAILTGSSTIIADNPTMECNIKVVLDRTRRTDLNSKIYQNGKVYIVVDENLDCEPLNGTLELIKCPVRDGKFVLKSLTEILFKKGICSILVEAGGKLNGSFLAENLIDKVYHFIAPKIIGDNAAMSCFDGMAVLDIEDAQKFSQPNLQIFSPDLLLTYTKS